MEAKDLMVGDYVSLNNLKHTTVKISKLDNKSATLYDGKNYMTFNYEYFSPIPLTEELLELNNFVKSRFNEFRFQYTIKNKLYLKDWHDKWFIYNDTLEIRYVHELQHLLRLCGEDEIADKFKVKKLHNKEHDNEKNKLNNWMIYIFSGCFIKWRKLQNSKMKKMNINRWQIL